ACAQQRSQREQHAVAVIDPTRRVFDELGVLGEEIRERVRVPRGDHGVEAGGIGGCGGRAHATPDDARGRPPRRGPLPGAGAPRGAVSSSKRASASASWPTSNCSRSTSRPSGPATQMNRYGRSYGPPETRSIPKFVSHSNPASGRKTPTSSTRFVTSSTTSKR